MKTLFNAILLLTSIKLLAQPVDVKKPKDQSESSKPYLICARNEREFAKTVAGVEKPPKNAGGVRIFIKKINTGRR